MTGSSHHCWWNRVEKNHKISIHSGSKFGYNQISCNGCTFPEDFPFTKITFPARVVQRDLTRLFRSTLVIESWLSRLSDLFKVIPFVKSFSGVLELTEYQKLQKLRSHPRLWGGIVCSKVEFLHPHVPKTCWYPQGSEGLSSGCGSMCSVVPTILVDTQKYLLIPNNTCWYPKILVDTHEGVRGYQVGVEVCVV